MNVISCSMALLVQPPTSRDGNEANIGQVDHFHSRLVGYFCHFVPFSYPVKVGRDVFDVGRGNTGPMPHLSRSFIFCFVFYLFYFIMSLINKYCLIFFQFVNNNLCSL